MVHAPVGMALFSRRTSRREVPLVLSQNPLLSGFSQRAIASNSYTGDFSFKDLLHARCGHVSLGNAALHKELTAAFGKSYTASGSSFCEACVRSKMHRMKSRAPALRRATRPLERVHFDISPGIPVTGVGGFTGYVLLVDEFTDMVFVRPLRAKSELLAILQEWRLMAQAHFATVLHGLSFPTTLANVRSDCAGENTSAAFLRWCKDTGIHAENSAPYSQWQDGRAEINIKTAWAGSEAMRKHSSSPPEHWPLTLEAFVTTRNLMPKRVGLSPWERWWNVAKPFKERIAHLRTYGCACWALVPKELRKKLDDKATFGIFVGYSPTSKAYRILDPQSGRVGVATSVVFDETVMPFVVAGRNMADSLDKFSFPTMLPNCSPPVVCADDPGDTPATVGDGAPSAVNCDSTLRQRSLRQRSLLSTTLPCFLRLSLLSSGVIPWWLQILCLRRPS